MKAAATIAFVAALAASGAAIAQGVGLRVGAVGAGGGFGLLIAPALEAGTGYSVPDSGSRRPPYEGGVQRSGLSGMVAPDDAIAPYLGIGYGRVAGAGVHFYFDLGVVYQGFRNSPLGGACATAPWSAQCALLQPDAAAGRSVLERSLDQYNLAPVGRVGVTFGF
jgi:hypothetical protein